MSRRGAILELAVLGLLHESDLHGYELRKRLSGVLGAFRAVSFGSLYPCLRSLVARGWITERADATSGRRPRITYALTPLGRAQFQDLLSQSGPQTWEDETFDVRFAFFGMASSDVRLRILEGRRARLAEQLVGMRSGDGAERGDRWAAALAAHGEEATERAVAWLDELIDAERRGPQALPGTLSDPSHPAFNPPPTKENP